MIKFMYNYEEFWMFNKKKEVFLITTPGSLFTEISEADNCENSSSDERFLSILKIHDCQLDRLYRCKNEKISDRYKLN